MACVKEIFAENLKKNRRKLGISQEILAEKACISTHYVSMIEMARNFPKSEVIERLANALEIEVHELFLVPQSPADELKKLHMSIINQIKQTISESVASSVETAFKKLIITEEIRKKT
ncbi:MAG: helix-turn-helix domain-containing protein [Treponema sp.]|nr:helix-turn-helix domain-containing protein [Treponema sp.]